MSCLGTTAADGLGRAVETLSVGSSQVSVSPVQAGPATVLWMPGPAIVGSCSHFPTSELCHSGPGGL